MATVAELQAIAKELGMTGYSKLRKSELEALVADAQHQEVTQPVSKSEAARIAGERGKSAAPMGNEHRARVYASQRGAHWLEVVDIDRAISLHTPRQARRVRKAENRAKGCAA